VDFRLTPSMDGAAHRSRQADLDEQTEAALRTRMLIGQAAGILMQREGLDSDGAFARLVDTSQRSNTKLREVARRIVEHLDGTNRPR
jgi:AmiR/NasT family two-component response regulator